MRTTVKVGTTELGQYKKTKVDIAKYIRKIERYSGLKMENNPTVKEYDKQRKALFEKYRGIETDKLFIALEHLAVCYLLTKSQNRKGVIMEDVNGIGKIYLFTKGRKGQQYVIHLGENVDLMNEPYNKFIGYGQEAIVTETPTSTKSRKAKVQTIQKSAKGPKCKI